MLKKACIDQKGEFFNLIKIELMKLKYLKYFNFEVKLKINKLKYKLSNKNSEVCLNKQKTYALLLRVPVEIIYNKKLLFF